MSIRIIIQYDKPIERNNAEVTRYVLDYALDTRLDKATNSSIRTINNVGNSGVPIFVQKRGLIPLIKRLASGVPKMFEKIHKYSGLIFIIGILLIIASIIVVDHRGPYIALAISGSVIAGSQIIIHMIMIMI